MASWGLFCTFALFAIKNQQDQYITSIQNGVPRIGPAAILEPKIKISQNVFYNKGSTYTEFDPLNTNLSTISHFEF